MEKGTKLLEGSIWKGVVAFAIPLFLGNLFQQLYNTVDSLIVGNFLGSDALAAVRAALTPELEGSCCRIELTGEAAPVDLAALQAALEAQFFSLDLRDRTRPKQDLWEACGEDTLRGHFLDGLHAQFEAAETDERRQVVARAARLGLALMDGREVPL